MKKRNKSTGARGSIVPMCGLISRLTDALDPTKKNGLVRRWADMDEEERKRIEQQYRCP